MTSALLIEIGCEELPAGYVNAALAAMPDLVTSALDASRLTHGAARALGTPRRLAILVAAVADRTPDLEEEVLGPPKGVAFEDDGRPKKAAEGFAKKNGVPVDAVRIVKTDKGEYAAVTRKEQGRDAASVIAEITSALPSRIPFKKSMRWGAGDLAFGRPIHWIIALFGDDIVPGSFAGIAFGRTSRGHRFLAPRAIAIASASQYVETLRGAHVLVDEATRRARMVDGLEAATKKLGGVLVPDAFLVEENASLVEEPHIVVGTFEDRFLALPEEVIVAVMRGHQRYFAVRDAAGKLMPRYLCVANTALDPARVAKGNDRVLRARLRDAEFFVAEDQKTTLAARVPKLDGIVFQNKLGSVGDKVRRVASVAHELSGDTRALDASKLAKADLVSLIVGEFPELQGLMGRWYALKAGLDAEVADAIRDHYLPKGAGDAIPTSKLAASIAIADRADTLVGCFGIGIVPTGSQDPFALRRAALALLRILEEGPLAEDEVGIALTLAYDQLQKQQKPIARWDELGPKLEEFLRARLRVMHSEKHPADVVDACLAAWDFGSVRSLEKRVAALDAFRAHPAYATLATAFKRAWNIAKDTAPREPDVSRLEAGAERDLWAAFVESRVGMRERVSTGDYAGALALVASDLRDPVDRFFTDVFVMVDDARVREHRLGMLRTIADSINTIAHLHLLGG